MPNNVGVTMPLNVGVTLQIFGVELCTLFGAQPEREQPLRKPVAMPET